MPDDAARPRSPGRLGRRDREEPHTTAADPPVDPPVDPHVQTSAEEVANAVTHGAAAVAAAALFAGVIGHAIGGDDAYRLTSAIVYAIGLVALFATSACYHACRPASAMKRRWRSLDHAAIYVLIAATYTPVLLVTLRGPWGWTLLSIVWAAAVVGCAMKLRSVERHPGWSTAMYLAMGWIGIGAIKPLVDALPMAGFAWILAGGLLYTIGVAFYAWERLPFNHAIWHGFVTAAGACHFVAIRGYVLA